MALTIERVKLADVYPLEDEFGNQFTSRDYSLKANQEYVRELAESMRAKGEPDEPVKLVRDGGIYRIKAGNSRVRAMRELGTKECWALVDDEDTVQSVLETVIRTDVKKTYEAVEKSRYVQQLAMFGDDDYVSEVSGISKEKVRKVRRARKAVGDAGDDMTLERMILVDEFADDPEAVKKLTECKEAEAQQVAARLRRNREMAEKRQALEAAMKALGVPVVRDRADVAGMKYFVMVPNAHEAADYLPEKWDAENLAAYIIDGSARCELYVSEELQEENEDPDRAEERRLTDAYEEAVEEMDAERIAWVWGNFAKGVPMPNLEREARSNFMNIDWVSRVLDTLPDDALAVVENEKATKLAFALGYRPMANMVYTVASTLARGVPYEYDRIRLSDYIDAMAMHQADGWDPGDGHALIAKLTEIVDGEEE